jgi:plastocyanin
MKRWTLVAVPVISLAVVAFAPRAERAAPLPATHRVQMLQRGAEYLYVPNALTIAAGDVIDFVNVSGFPHNVQFTPNRVPAGAPEVLNRAMANRIGPLQGPLMVQPNAVYSVSFAGAPAGTYEVVCLPHQALNMKMTVTVRGGAAR